MPLSDRQRLVGSALALLLSVGLFVHQLNEFHNPTPRVIVEREYAPGEIRGCDYPHGFPSSTGPAIEFDPVTGRIIGDQDRSEPKLIAEFTDVWPRCITHLGSAGHGCWPGRLWINLRPGDEDDEAYTAYNTSEHPTDYNGREVIDYTGPYGMYTPPEVSYHKHQSQSDRLLCNELLVKVSVAEQSCGAVDHQRQIICLRSGTRTAGLTIIREVESCYVQPAGSVRVQYKGCPNLSRIVVSNSWMYRITDSYDRVLFIQARGAFCLQAMQRLLRVGPNNQAELCKPHEWDGMCDSL